VTQTLTIVGVIEKTHPTLLGDSHGISTENVQAEIAQTLHKNGLKNQSKKYWSQADERWYQTLKTITLPRLEIRRNKGRI